MTETTQNFEYRVKYSGRRSIGISISPVEGIIVRAPYGTSGKTIERIIQDNSDWIAKILVRFNDLKRLGGQNGFSDGNPVLFMGKQHTLKIIPSDQYYVRLNDINCIEVGINGNKNPAITETLLESWFKTVARKKLTAQFQNVLTKYDSYGFKPTVFVVSTMKKRWGSCSGTGRIAISYDLIRLDEIYAEYVMVHELCHLRHHNHGEGFYKLLTEIFPSWKQVRKELKNYVR